MLDGIPCNSVGAKGCQNAESVGHGITTSGDYVKLGGNIYPDLKVWVFTNGNVMNFKSNDEGIALSTLESEIEDKAGNGLYYTGTNGPFSRTYTAKSDFGVRSWSSATCDNINRRMNSTNICAIRGMRLPTYSETNISSSSSYNPCGETGNVNGVPEHPRGFAWTSTANLLGTDRYFGWKERRDIHPVWSNSGYVRCVR